MRSIQRFLVALLFVLVAGSATAVSVSTNFLPETDFSKFHTYYWVKVEGQNVDPITDEQIKRAVDAQLQAKGWRRVESSEADAYVAYQVAVTQTQELNYYSNYGYGWRWGRGWACRTTPTSSPSSTTRCCATPRRPGSASCRCTRTSASCRSRWSGRSPSDPSGADQGCPPMSSATSSRSLSG